MATTKKTGTAVVLWEQEMKAAAAKQSTAEKEWGGGGGFGQIKITGGRMSIDGEYIKDDQLDVVILAAVHLNEYYDKAYDPKNPTVPVCFAYGDETLDDPEAEMAPIPDDVDDIQLMDAEGGAVANCTDCWANQMGSADVGKGKACKNVRRMLVMTEDGLESAEALDAAEVRSLGVPVMSVRNWVKYMKDVLSEQLERPYYGVVTTISVVPDPKSQYKVQFEFKELINFDQDLWEAMKKKTADCAKEIIAPYPHQADLDAAKAADAPKGKGPVKASPMKPVGRVAQAAVGKPPIGKAAAPAKGKKY
jgi:hypothetical protein